MKKNKIGVLLVNLGTPLSPKTSDVRRYLRQFLMDRRVIDIPFLNRFLLINGIIAPFRSPKSAKEYKKLWTSKGSPLLFHGVGLKEKLQKSLDSNYTVYLAMRYQSPSIKSVLENMQTKKFEKIIIIPLFPQYASASTGSVQEAVMKYISKWLLIPTLVFINQFSNHPSFIKAFVEIGKPYFQKQNYDHVLFSYHGLPERQLKKADSACKARDCCHTYTNRNRLCYRAQCFATTEALTKSLSIKEGQYTTCFQSRLGKTPWIQPYTDEILQELAKKGIKKLLVFSPSFIADCLETTIEIGETYKTQFESLFFDNQLTMVESLNSNAIWVEALKDIITKLKL